MKLLSLFRNVSLLAMSTLSLSVGAELVVEEGYVRKPIPGRVMTAAFMTLSNQGAQDIVLTSATLEGASSVEIHTHSHVDGVMRMRQIHQLTVEAGEQRVLEPGGLHLMIFGIKDLPESPKLTLCDANDECFTSQLSLRSLVK